MREIATLGGGCFWCLEAVYDDLIGVESAVSGYAGGKVKDPTYEIVCTGRTGHAEVVRLTYDADTVSFRDLLEVFFSIHNPTTLNRQGNDVGTQYRSVIFYHNDSQRRVAEDMIRELTDEGVYKDPIVTTVEPAPAFYEAEPYHQEYYRNNPNQGYCQIVIAPKLSKFRSKYRSRLKSRAAATP